ncbi:kinase-like domain-containing protein [Mycena pura]|uniref:Kinase-like domain-containing protein n=1 Tax=Mycena pura TaxID=153505 RepID=A0AAD6Y2K7_9AGAR|nr:kinase-like domain-containing protein [Mycena pura]
MSEGEIRLCTLPPTALADVEALANPRDPFSLWISLVYRGRFSSESVTWTMGLGSASDGENSFVLDADPQVFGSGAGVTLRYERNRDVLECAENTALDKMLMPSFEVLTEILSHIDIKPGWRRHVEFKTLPDGSLYVVQGDAEPHPKAEILSNPVPLPSVPLSFLRTTHQLPWSPNIYLVKSVSDHPFDGVRVFKTSNGQSSLAKEVEFMVRFLDVEFFVPPSHIVVDDAGGLHGLLLDYHPASALRLVIHSAHPDTEPFVLPPAGVVPSDPPLPGPAIPWAVKLAWAVDIAASLAYLHAMKIFWGDLKTDNILLCTDGHCRLIDYCPGGRTDAWSAPEAEGILGLRWAATAEGDVFALGLVLWSIAVEVEDFERVPEFVCPQLSWDQETPDWFQTLVLSCIEHDPALRPSARSVYDTLTHELASLE